VSLPQAPHREVTYTASDEKNGMLPSEARRAFEKAERIVRVRLTWKGRLRSVTVMEP